MADVMRMPNRDFAGSLFGFAASMAKATFQPDPPEDPSDRATYRCCDVIRDFEGEYLKALSPLRKQQLIERAEVCLEMWSQLVADLKAKA